MTIPETLLTKVDELFVSFGGLKAVQELYTEQQLIQAALFYGPSITLTNFTTASKGITGDPQNLQVVNHGSTVDVLRPVGEQIVYWSGSAEPTNVLEGDIWSSISAGSTDNTTQELQAIYHDTTATTVRPANTTVVYWIGSVQPLNAQNGDLWSNTSNNLLEPTAQGFKIVGHGLIAETPRPTNTIVVYWIGSVRPLNAQNGDLWAQNSQIGQTIPVPRIDFQQLGYIPGSVVQMLDKNKTLLHTTVLKKLTDGTSSELLWGLSTDQKEFIDSQPHGKQLFLVIQSTKGDLLIQIFVNKRRHPEDIFQETKELRRQTTVQQAVRHELILSLPKSGLFYELWFYETAVTTPQTREILKEKENIYRVRRDPGEVLYITPSGPGWFFCESDNGTLLSLEDLAGTGVERVRSKDGLYQLRTGASATGRQLAAPRVITPTRGVAPIRLTGKWV